MPFLDLNPAPTIPVANPGIGYAFSETPIHIGDTFSLDIRAENVFDLAGWQFDIAFDPAILEAIDVSEGDFLKTDGGSTFFQSGRIDNAAGKITGLIAGRISEGGVSGSGSVLQVRFKAKSARRDTVWRCKTLSSALVPGKSSRQGLLKSASLWSNAY